VIRRLRRFIAAVRKCYPDERHLLDDGRDRLACTSPGAFAPQLQRDRAALGLDGRGVKLVQGFRALYAHRLREQGAPLDAIKNLLGHSDIKVTEGYCPASQTRERAAVALRERSRARALQFHIDVELAPPLTTTPDGFLSELPATPSGPFWGLVLRTTRKAIKFPPLEALRRSATDLPRQPCHCKASGFGRPGRSSLRPGYIDATPRPLNDHA
jgi:hypothetical protein